MKALEAENEKLRGSLAELEQSAARLRRQVADLKDDEAKVKEALRKYEVRLLGLMPSWGSCDPSFLCEWFRGRKRCHNLVGKVKALVTMSSLHTNPFFLYKWFKWELSF